jgi:hypothetical protein
MRGGKRDRGRDRGSDSKAALSILVCSPTHG